MPIKDIQVGFTKEKTPTHNFSWGSYIGELRHNPYYHFTGNCGAQYVTSMEEFNNLNNIIGVTVIVNPKREEIKEFPHTQVDIFKMGRDTIAFRYVLSDDFYRNRNHLWD
jgi:hypothetical protein